MKKQLKFLFAVLLLLAVGTITHVSQAVSANDSGVSEWSNWGTVKWGIDSNGTLWIKPQSGSTGKLDSLDNIKARSPWYESRTNIKSVKLEGTIVAASKCLNLFKNLTNCTDMDLTSLDTSKVTNMASMFDGCNNLTNLDVSNWDTRNVTNMNFMFSDCKTLTNLDVSKWNTSAVKNMDNMFFGCSSLTKLDASKWDTGKVTNMHGVFNCCYKLANLDVSKWDTGKVTDMSYMFNSCSSLNNLDVSNWNTSAVTDMEAVFKGCDALTKLDASKWDMSKVTRMDRMFQGCEKLSSLDASKWDMSKVTRMDRMFQGCEKLSNLDVSKWSTSKLWSMQYTFDGCSSLTKLDFSNWDTSNIFGCDFMLRNTDKLQSITFGPKFGINIRSDDIGLKDDFNKRDSSLYSKWVRTSDDMIKSSNDLMTMDASKRTGTWIAKKMTVTVDVIDANKNTVLESGTLDNYKTIIDKWTSRGYTEGASNVPVPAKLDPYASSYKMAYKVYMDPAPHVYAVYNNGTLTFIQTTETPTLKTDDISVKSTNGNIYTGRVYEADGSWRESDDEYVYGLNSEIKTVNLTTKVKPLSTKNWFNGCYDLTSVKNAQRFDMSNNTDMSRMFQQCYKLANLDVSNWDTRNVTNMNFMFSDCKTLTNLDVSKWNTGNVTDMSGMFAGCKALTNLDVSNWKTSKVADMSYLFNDCFSLTDLDVSKWDTGNVTTMSNMFGSCHALTNLDVSKWDTSKVTDMRLMFYECKTLSSLDVSKWDTSKVTNMRYMFYYCWTLTNLDVSKWNTSQVTSLYGTFDHCSDLANLDVSKWNTSKVTDMESTFSGCEKVAILDVSKWNTSNVTTMRDTFSGCEKVAILDVSKWNTSKVTDMESTFSGCEKVAILDVSKWDTSNVTTMRDTFGGCEALTKLDLSKWDTRKVTDMFVMFSGCSNLAKLDVSNWDTSKVTDIGYMFDDCKKLAGLDLSSWDTSNVTNSYLMFVNTYELQSLTLGPKFNINSTETDLSDNFNYWHPGLYSKWVRTSDDMIKSSNDLMTMDASKRAGTWVAKKMTATVDIVDSNKNTVLESGAIDNYESIVDKWAHRGYTEGTNNLPVHPDRYNINSKLDPYAPSYKMTYKVYMNPKASTYSVSTTTPKGTYTLKDGKQVGTKTVNLTVTMSGGAYFNFDKSSSVINNIMSQITSGWNIKSTKYTLIDGYGKTVHSSENPGGCTVVFSVEFAVDQDRVTENYGEFTPVLPSGSDSYDAISGSSVRITLPDVYKVTSLATRTSPSSTMELWRDTVYAFYKLTALRAGNHSTLGDLTFTNGRTSHNRPLEDLSYDGQAVNSHITVHMPIDWNGYKVDHMDSYKQYDTNMWFEYFNNYDNPDMAVVNIDNHMFDTTWYKPDHILFDDKTYWREVPYSQLSVRDDDGKFDTSTLTNTYAFLQNSGDYLTAKAGYGLEYPYQVLQQFYDESANYMVDDNETVESAAWTNAAPCGYATTSNLYDDTLTSDINHEELRFYTSSKQLNNLPTDKSNVFNELYAKFETLFYPMQFKTLTNITARSKSLKNGFQAYADVSHDIVIFNSPKFKSPSNYATYIMYENNYYGPDHPHVDYIKDNVKDGIYPLNINATIGNVTVNKNFKIQIYGSRMASKDRPNGEINLDGTLSGTTSDTADKLKDRYGITDEQAKQLKEFLKN